MTNPLQESINEERARFEVHCKIHKLSTERATTILWKGEAAYVNTFTQAAWQAWAIATYIFEDN